MSSSPRALCTGGLDPRDLKRAFFCISFLRKGEVLACVGIHNQKDLKDRPLQKSPPQAPIFLDIGFSGVCPSCYQTTLANGRTKFQYCFTKVPLVSLWNEVEKIMFLCKKLTHHPRPDSSELVHTQNVWTQGKHRCGAARDSHLLKVVSPDTHIPLSPPTLELS